MPKIAVFSTSHIFTWSSLGASPDLVLKYTCEDGTLIHSTSALERAIAEGYEVYVISTRRTLGPHDAWWLAMVPEDRVIVGRYTGAGAEDVGMIKAWRELYVRLGEDPDSLRLSRASFNVPTREEMESFARHRYEAVDPQWPAFEAALPQVGFKSGRDFL